MQALLFFILIVLVFILVKLVFKKVDDFKKEFTPNQKPNQAPTKKMVTCHTCGIHLPEEDALALSVINSSQVKYACCEEHIG